MRIVNFLSMNGSTALAALALAFAVAGTGLLSQQAMAESSGNPFLNTKRAKTEVPGESPQEKPAEPVTAARKEKPSENVVVGNWQNSAGGGGRAITETQVVADQAEPPLLLVDSSSRIQNSLSHYEGIVASGGWPRVPKGGYRKGSKGEGVAALNRRLFAEGYVRQEATEGEFAPIFTSATEEGVRRFQRNHGLPVSGKVDGPTLAALNVSAEQRVRTIRANVPRLAEYTKDLGQRYIVVNVPSMQLETVENGRVVSRHNVIVGKQERPTPVVMTALSDINFNPYWNVPASIIEKDLIPKMLQSNNKVLKEMNIKVFQGVGGPEIDPDTVDWRRAIADDYHFRQEPGGENAMAAAKINFPSPFGIYLHDTPQPEFFAYQNRYLSSGCVRVQKVDVLLNWILQGQDGIGTEQISSLAQTLERRDVKLAVPPQLRVVYLTAWPAPDGTVAFRDDVYDLDGTGFVVGQPLPVGETASTGERFVLKPLPRQAQAVDEAEAEGFSLFSFGTRQRNAPSTSSTKQVGAAALSAEEKNVSSKISSNVITQPALGSKKPVKKTAAKPAANCKPGKDGKLPKGCKAAEVKKKATSSTAAN